MGLFIYGLEDAEKQTRTNLLRELPLFGKVGTTRSRKGHYSPLITPPSPS